MLKPSPPFSQLFSVQQLVYYEYFGNAKKVLNPILKHHNGSIHLHHLEIQLATQKISR